MTAYFKHLRVDGRLSNNADRSDNLGQTSATENILLFGDDPKEIMKKRLQNAGAEVTRAASGSEVLELARHRSFKQAVLLANSSLANAAEIAFNLHDLNGSIKIFIIIDSRWKNSHRSLKQLYDHPIAGTEILMRRQLQRQLRAANARRGSGAAQEVKR